MPCLEDISPIEELVNLATLTDLELDEIGKDQAARAMLERTLPFLFEQKTALTITEENYTPTLRALRQRYKEGSQALSDVIVRAHQLKLANDTCKVEGVYRDYIATCDIPFYKRIAKARLQKLGR